MKRYKCIFNNNKQRTKGTCPKCGKPKSFVRYIFAASGEYLPEEYGKCDRENSCGYWLNPYKDGYLERTQQYDTAAKKTVVQVRTPAVQDLSYIPLDALAGSLTNYDVNNLVLYLTRILGTEATTRLIEKYYLGTSKRWHGANVFWKVDIKGRITAGKVMLYNSKTGKRVKEPFSLVDSAHNLLNLPEPRPTQCLFGEHLLKGDIKPVAIVESEKTALIASVYFPKLIWLACGGLGMLTQERCEVLRGRSVTLFPDINGFAIWSKKAKDLASITNFSVSDFLEKFANETEKKEGLDLADYLISIH